ncbi:hypothetical protein [Caudoviricetes sp.]|nr:hypothetical protein [Caudoviricetes sp.]
MAGNDKRKSDDARLSDAKEARAARDAGEVDPDNELDSLTDELQDSVAQAKIDGATAQRLDQMDKAFARLLDIVEEIKRDQMKTRSVDLAAPNKGLVTPSQYPKGMKCPTCAQYPGICEGKHVTMIVAPAGVEFHKSFPGVIWNGVKYYGRCIVPKAIVDDLVVAVRQWEYGEKLTQFGRTKVVQDGKVHQGLFVYDQDFKG